LTGVGLLDTSVVVALRGIDVRQLPTFPVISAVTLAELGVGPLVAADSQERQRRQLVLQSAEATFDPLPFDAKCARQFAQIAGELRNSGSKSRARAFDALIAATALVHGLPLFTCNSRDFAGISHLTVVEVTTT
jgi:tRNA(fMet)-specific endonuclease VapC